MLKSTFISCISYKKEKASLHLLFSLVLDRVCMDGSYADISSGACINCSSVCVISGECSGPAPLAGQGGCGVCRVMLTFSNGTQVSSETSIWHCTIRKIIYC